MSMLEVKDLVVSYGGIEALKGISFSVDEGQIVTLIGANGAGKSTTLRAITGLVPVKSGSIFYNGEDITRLATQKTVERGIALVPEGRRVFANLTVLENLKIGAYLRKDTRKIQEDIEYIYTLFPRLKERYKQMAGTLSGGELQRVLLALALEPIPNILILDEPLSGVDVEGMETLMDMLDEIRKNYDLSILMTTHDFSLLPRYADQVVLIDHGVLIQGDPQTVLDSEEFHRTFHMRGGRA